MYIIPQDLLKKFQAVSAYNFSVNGRHVETLAYLFGHEEDGNLVGTHLVFPQHAAELMTKVTTQNICS